MAKKYSSENKASVSAKAASDLHQPLFGRGGAVAAVVLMFALTIAGSMDNILEKWSGLAASLVLLALIFIVKRTAVFKEYITPLFYSIAAYIVWGGISTFYASSGKFAIFEFSKLLVALCVYMAVLFFSNADQSYFSRISAIFASVGCFFGIISVDAASFGVLTKLFRLIFGAFTTNFDSSGAFEQGIRIPGIFGNPNTYAGFMALAVLLSLYLVSQASAKRDTVISISLLAINSLAYLLSFSMGSLVMFLAACLIMLISSEKGNRVSLFILMLETAVITFLFIFVSMLGLGKTGIIAFIPVLALFLNAACLYVVDAKLRPALTNKMNSNTRILISTILILCIIIAGYTASAFLISGDLSLTAGESIMRGIYVPAGEYSLNVESSKPVSVNIESQNNYDLMRHTSTTLFSGTNDSKINFTVPENSKIVQIHFIAADSDAEITKAAYTGPENGSVHLRYPLLPNIIANRLQNLFANENVVQRTIFFEDGLKLFAKSPVIGRGLGGFENGAYSVQSFYYETKYAHNHYIQALSDLGIIGLILFLSILAFSVLSIAKARKHARSLYAVPVLAACVTQMFGQALVDAVWSTGVFLGFAAAILGLITIFCAEPLPLKESFNKNRLRLIEAGGLVLFTCIFVILLSGNLYAQAQAKAGVKDFNEIERLIAIDRFESNDYKLSYIINAPSADSDEITKQAYLYADQLSKVESNSLTPYIMEFDFRSYLDANAYEVAKKGLKTNNSNPKMWPAVFGVMEAYVDPVGPNVQDAADRLRNGQFYIDGVVDLYNSLVKRNKESLDDIMLTPENQAFIGKCLEIQATHQYSVDWVFTAMMTYAFDSVCAVDANSDGIPDCMTVLAGDLKRVENGRFDVSANTTVELALYHKLHGNYTFDIETDTPQGITISYNGVPQTVQYEKGHAFVQLQLGDNTNKDLSTFNVSFPVATEIKSITFTTKLEQ